MRNVLEAINDRLRLLRGVGGGKCRNEARVVMASVPRGVLFSVIVSFPESPHGILQQRAKEVTGGGGRTV